MMPTGNSAEAVPETSRSLPVEEYLSAAMRFLSDAHDAVMRANSPLVGRIPSQRVEAMPTTRYALGEDVHEEDPMKAEALVTMRVDAVRKCDIDELMALIGEIAFTMGKQLQAELLAHVGRLSEASGTTVDGSGKGFVDGLIETLERMDLSVDDDGQLALPTVVLNPDTEIPKPTPEQTERLNEVLVRKEAEARARRPDRRLR